MSYFLQNLKTTIRCNVICLFVPCCRQWVVPGCLMAGRFQEHWHEDSTWPAQTCHQGEHMQPETKWLPFCRQHWQMHVLICKLLYFDLRFHWCLLLRFQLTGCRYWLRQWLDAGQATSYKLNQFWPRCMAQLHTRSQWVNKLVLEKMIQICRCQHFQRLFHVWKVFILIKVLMEFVPLSLIV